MDARAETDARNYLKQTPLHLSVIWGNPVAALLIEEGVEVNARDKCGKTPLTYAVEMNREVATVIRENGGIE